MGSTSLTRNGYLLGRVGPVLAHASLCTNLEMSAVYPAVRCLVGLDPLRLPDLP